MRIARRGRSSGAFPRRDSRSQLSPEADLGPRLLRGCFPQRTELSPLRASRPRASADPSSPPLLPSQPFNEAFDIVRFRECELQHSRWAMLGLVGAVVAESETGISWVDAGKVLNEQPQYLGFDINVPVTTLVWIEVLTMGFAEVKRSSELDSNKRCYPGGYFDPLGAYRVYASKRLFIFLASANLFIIRFSPRTFRRRRIPTPVNHLLTLPHPRIHESLLIIVQASRRPRTPRRCSSSKPRSSSTAASR